MFLSDKRVIVTGGAGFLGSVVVEKLRARGCLDVVVPRSSDYDLRDSETILRLYRDTQPHLVIHLAAVVGGIGANQANPGRFFYDNASARELFGFTAAHRLRDGIPKTVAWFMSHRHELREITFNSMDAAALKV
jgi:nucleoside-diphosphate-sugar epimerase